MTRIEKAVKIVSDLYDFYRRIPIISDRDKAKKEGCSQTLQGVAREPASRSPESPSSPRR
jgi:hypothetical protein